MKNKILSLVISLILSVSMVSANIVNTGEIGDAISSGDFSKADELIRKEIPVTETVSGIMNVNENNVIKDFNFNILGMQNEIMKDGDIFFNKFTNEFTDGLKAMADIMYDIPNARWGGGTANYIGLFENMGPIQERKPSIYLEGTPYGNAKAGQVAYEGVTMGPVEFIKMIQMINPDASFIFCLPLDVNTPEQTLNFTRFLLDGKDESKWGALRASYGIEEPVNLYGFELGNEDYFSAEPDVVLDNYDSLTNEEKAEFVDSERYIELRDEAIDRYINTSLEHLNTIHSAYPDVKFYPNVNGGLDRVSCEAWDCAVANRLCNQPGVDGVAYHAYYSGYTSTETNMRRMDTIQSWFVRETGKKTKFIHTEHAKWGANESITRQSHYSALCEPFFINAMQMRDDVLTANYHNIVCGSTLQNPGTWAFFTRKGDKYYEAGINKVYKLYTENMGNKIIQSDIYLRNNEGDGATAIATKKDDGTIVLAITNYYEDKNIDLDLQFKGEYTLTKDSVFTAPNYSSIVYGESTKDVFRVTTSYGKSSSKSYLLPSKSLVILELTPKKSGDKTEYKYQENINENFDSYKVTTTPFTLNKSLGISNVKTVGNWTLKAYRSLLYSKNSTVAVTSNKTLKMTPTACSYLSTAFPVLEYGGGLEELGEHFQFKFDYNKINTASGGGIKFMIHNNGKNYYVLWLCGLSEESYKWIFNKVVDNEVAATVNGEEYTGYSQIKEGTKSGPIHGNGTVTLEYDAGKISWKIDGYEYKDVAYSSTGSYKDKSPFTVNIGKTTFAFGSNSSNADETRGFEYDNISVGSFVADKTVVYETTNSENYPKLKKNEDSKDEFVVNGEPSNVIYVDRTTAFSKNILYFPIASAIRKIVNTGDTKVKVYASTDDYSYKLIAEVEPREAFVNNLSDQKFSYVKLEGGTAKIYTDLNDNTVLTAKEDVCDLLAYVNGNKDNITYTSSNRNIAYIEDNKLIPLRNGTVTITATRGTDSVSKTVKVSAFTEYSEDFMGYQRDTVFNSPTSDANRRINVGGDWYFIMGHNGTMSAVPNIQFTEKGLSYYGTGGVNIFYGCVPYLRYDGDYSGLSDKYSISMNYEKDSVMSGLGIRLGMHNDDSNYYMLELSSGGKGSGYVWSFYKVKDHVIVARKDGEEYTGYNHDGTGPLQGKGFVKIDVDGNKITWNINGKRYNNRPYDVTHTFEDDEPFDVSPRNTRIALVSYGYRNTYAMHISNFKFVGDDNKVIIDSPLKNGDKYVDMSNSTNPIKIIKDGNSYEYVKDNVGDKFFKITPSDYKTSSTKLLFWDLNTLLPYTSAR